MQETLAHAGWVCILVLFLAWPRAATADGPELTGPAVPELRALDQLLINIVTRHKIPGATLAVTNQGRLAYARGYGFSDVEQQQQVEPTSLFRIASVSKPITAVVVLQLVEKGKLKLDDLILDRLPTSLVTLTPEQRKEHPWKSITIQNCLQHSGGWDPKISFDPMFRTVEIAKSLKVDPPAGPNEIIRFMLEKPLDFKPGERFAYSNFGFCVLGRIIENATGKPYGEAVQENLWKRLKVTEPRLGRTLLTHRAAHEVRYYEGDAVFPSIFAENLGQDVLKPYGTFSMEALDSCGGWVCSGVDLMKFATAFDRPDKSPLLRPKTIQQMFSTRIEASQQKPAAKPVPGASPMSPVGPERSRNPYYGLGWNVRETRHEGKINTWHNGSVEGTMAIFVRRFDGTNWVILCNTRHGREHEKIQADMDQVVNEAVAKVEVWPKLDLFRRFK